MKKLLVLGILFTLSFNAFSQTKKIAHRSHSGKNSTLILTTEDNFGLPEHVKKDTVAKKVTVVKKKKVYRKKKKVNHTAIKPIN